MYRRVPVFLLLTLILAGCGKSTANNALVPPENPSLSATGENAQIPRSVRQLWGYWEVTISPESSEATVEPVRSAEFHLNALKLLEKNPCQDCLGISNIQFLSQNRIVLDVTIKHPGQGNPDFVIYDVRGIFLTDSDFSFPGNDVSISWDGTHPRLLNPDGCTTLFNAVEFPPDQPGPQVLKYVPGKWATDPDPDATLNPFVAFERDAIQRAFGVGKPTTTRTMHLEVPSGEIEFGYAVDASWVPVDTFPLSPNCPEAYAIRVEYLGALGNSSGSETGINVVPVYHDQPFGTTKTVTMECPQLFEGIKSLKYGGSTSEGYSMYTGLVVNDLGADEGEYPLLIRVDANGYDPNLGAMSAWTVGSVRVSEGSSQGWCRAWGTPVGDSGNGIAMDLEENIYVAGQVWGTSRDAFLAKTDWQGNPLWAYSWGGEWADICYDVAVYKGGYIYVTGCFAKTVDFDPGPGVTELTAQGESDAFLSCFNTKGQFVWARAWGSNDAGDPVDVARGLAVDEKGDIYVTGCFGGTVDFDPGTDMNKLKANNQDVFLTKFDALGNHLWAVSWGGTGLGDVGYGVACDGEGNICVCGSFENSVDFDPSVWPEMHQAKGGKDAFMSKFSPDGDLIWVRTWGNTEDDFCHAVAAHDFMGIMVSGEYVGGIDLDPGAGTFWVASEVQADYVSAFTASGAFTTATRSGIQPPPTTGGSPISGISFDMFGNMYVSGYFRGTYDFDYNDPGEVYVSKGEWDGFVSKYTPDLEHLWTVPFGGKVSDWGLDIVVSPSGRIYTTGFFGEKVDFDPGPDEDIHTAVGGSDIFLMSCRPDGTW